MEEQDQIIETFFNALRKLFYIIFFLSVFFMFPVFLIVHVKGAFLEPDKHFQYMVEIITYLLIFGGIPGLYYLHQKKLKIIESTGSIEEKIKTYKKLFLAKLLIIAALIFISGGLYFLMATRNFLIITTISFIYLLMNRPTYPNLFIELGLYEEDEEQNSDE